MEANEKLLIETAERAKSNTKRINELDEKTDVLQEILQDIKVLASTMGRMREDQKEIAARLAEIEKRPADRLKQITTAVISALAGAIITAIMSSIFINIK